MTETWLNVGDLSPFSELVPSECTFFNSPRITDRGGGLASVFKRHFGCRRLPADVYSSFELQSLQIDFNQSFAMCAGLPTSQIT